jgi:hypothetical protein
VKLKVNTSSIGSAKVIVIGEPAPGYVGQTLEVPSEDGHKERFGALLKKAVKPKK